MKRHTSTKILLVLLVSMLVMSHALLWAEQAQRVYSINIAGETVGQETSVAQLAPDGQSIHATANSSITIQGMAITLKHDLLLTTDYQLREYTLEAGVAGTTQRVSAIVEGDTVMMKGEAGPTSMEQSVPWQRGMVVLENNTAFDNEFLLRQYDRSAGGEQQFQALIPSMLMSMPITVRLAGSGTAMLNGSPVETENFVAEMMEIELKIWAAKESGQVLKIAVPSQQAEMVLQGASCPDFAVPAAAPAAPQDQRVYSIKMAGETVGQETSVVQLTPDGQGIHATAQLSTTVQGTTVNMKQDLLLTSDYQLKQYTFKIEMPEGTGQASAVVEGNTVVMKAQAGPMPLEEQRIPWQSGMVVREGAAINEEFLLRQYDRSAGGEQQFQTLIPSPRMSMPITVRLAGLGTAMLNGSPVETEYFVAENGVEIKIWAVRQTGLVLKVMYPFEQTEIVLQGASFPDVSAPPATPAATPVAPQEFPEKEVTFQSGKYTLYGTLTLPSSTNRPIPGVVLLHGSGPNDRDETIGANKPFRDLAHGLAARGIAVLRYDKRTYTCRTKFTRRDIINLTLKEEVLDDALSAIGFLRKQPGINSRSVFLVGHSLGAWCAPFIAAQDVQLAGVIMLAPYASEFDDAFIRQIQYRAQVMGASSEEIDQLIAEVRNGFSRLREKTFPSNHFLLGASGKYWYDYLSRRPLQVAAGLPQPILILQGEKDYQTTMDDFAAWKEALGDSRKTNVRFQIFPQLNHLFMPVDGPSTGQEYAIPGTVAPQVIETIAQFCLQALGRTR